jgi:hypothetical protein
MRVMKNKHTGDGKKQTGNKKNFLYVFGQIRLKKTVYYFFFPIYGLNVRLFAFGSAVFRRLFFMFHFAGFPLALRAKDCSGKHGIKWRMEN